jgi:ABC-type branched-subunit amino acid transport system substrate-binding protein
MLRVTLRRAAAVGLGAMALATGLAALPAFSGGCGEKAITAAPDTGAPLVIGVPLALTGDLGLSGASIQNAIRVAEAEVNAHGGVLGRRVVFKVTDDATDKGARLEGIVKGFLDEGAVAILGPRGSSQVLSIAPKIAQRRVPELSGSSTSSLLTGMQPATDRWFFRTIPSDSLQGKVIAIVASKPLPDRITDAGSGVDANEATAPDAGNRDGASDAAPKDAAPADTGAPVTLGCQRMAIVHADDDYGRPLATSTKAEFEKRGGTVVATVAIPPDVQASYASAVQDVLTPKPDCLVLVMFDPAADALVTELAKRIAAAPGALPPGFVILGADGVFKSTLIVNGRINKADPSSPTIVEGMYGTNPDPNPPTTTYADFRNLYLSHFALDQGETDLPGKVANYYDAAILIALALERSGDPANGAKVRDALVDVSRGGAVFGPAQVGEALAAIRAGKDIDYSGASGAVDFDDLGDVLGDYIIWKVEGGKFITVGRVEARELTP